jgi:hypothetical protein
LGLKRGKPGVVELDLAALEQLPCASIVGAFLNCEVDVTNRNIVFCLVVEDCLKRADDLLGVNIRIRAYETGTLHTTTPPISKRIAFGGLDDCTDITMEIVWCEWLLGECRGRSSTRAQPWRT